MGSQPSQHSHKGGEQSQPRPRLGQKPNRSKPQQEQSDGKGERGWRHDGGGVGVMEGIKAAGNQRPGRRK